MSDVQLPVIPDHAQRVSGDYALRVSVHLNDWMLAAFDLAESSGTIFETPDGSWEWDQTPGGDDESLCPNVMINYPDGCWWWVDPPFPPTETAEEHFAAHVEREGEVDVHYDHRIRAWFRICCGHCGTVVSSPAVWIHAAAFDLALDEQENPE